MPDYYCPSCETPLTPDAINIGEGVALCPSCGALSRLSELIENTRPSEEVVNNPPRGCTITDLGTKIRVRVSLRSLGGLLGSLFFCLFWNGIVSVFVLLAISGLYTSLVGPLPAWFPAPDNGDMGLGMSIFLCIFLIPFVTIGTIMIGVVFICLAGRLDIDIAPDRAQVRTAVGPVGWTKRFDPRAVRKVSIGKSKWETNGKQKPLVVIEADRTVRFGSELTDDKRAWVYEVLRGLLLGARSSSGRRQA